MNFVYAMARAALLSGGCLATLACAASASGNDPVGRFDFGYVVTGAPAARPLQVFDDGVGKTYFQFRQGGRVPVILVGRGPAVAAAEVQGPYHLVVGRAWDYTLMLGGASARVRHAGLVAGGEANAGSMGDASLPPAYDVMDRRTSSYATPTRGDVIEWIAPELKVRHLAAFFGRSEQLTRATREHINSVSKRLGPSAQVQIVTAQDAMPASKTGRSRIESLRSALLQAGIAKDRITIVDGDDLEGAGAARRREENGGLWLLWHGSSPSTQSSDKPNRPSHPPEQVHGRPLANNFDILASDKTFAECMRRWAKQSGHLFSWDAAIDAPITGELTVDATAFPEAVASVVRGLQDSGYPIQLRKEGSATYRVSRVAQLQ